MHGAELKVQVLAECQEPGASAAAVALAHGLNGRGPEALYDHIYCQRGEAENRIKEAQVGLFATRTSCHHFAENQLRVLLAALAYVLIERCVRWHYRAPSWPARRSIGCASGCSSWLLS
jgi:hypothetical protein